MDIKELIFSHLKSNFPNLPLEQMEFRGDFIVTLSGENSHSVMKFLKNSPELEFVRCDDITAIDWGTRQNRFTLVYHLYSFRHSFRLRIMLPVNDKSVNVETVSDIWKSADWYEREVFDMYGITFANHPDLRRMYMPEEFEYHPLRKEFPVMGIPGSLPLPKK